MKLSGGMLVWISMMFMGTALYYRLKKRQVFLEEITLFLSVMSLEIRYASLSLPLIISNAEKAEGFRNLDFIKSCLESFEKDGDFPAAWSLAISSSGLPFRKEEREKLIALGSLLGTSDSQGQQTIISLHKESFMLFSSRAREEFTRYGKMILTVSFVAGMGVFILLL